MPAHDGYATGWDTFQPMSGGSYGYYYWPKGQANHVRPAEHSMQLVQDLAVADLRNAPADQPLFEVLSTYAGHYPNVALPSNIGSPRCARIRPWISPRYGAAATRDKPAWLQSLARRRVRQLAATGYPLVKVCEDMLGVDQLVAKVVQEQRRRGRLDDTLLVLASDNGYLVRRLRHRGQVRAVRHVPGAVHGVARWHGNHEAHDRLSDIQHRLRAHLLRDRGLSRWDRSPTARRRPTATRSSRSCRVRTPEPRTSLLTVMLHGSPKRGCPAGPR